MKIVVFGLSISSSWGNGHATLWRALCRALGALGHQVVFFERDVPYYSANRDSTNFPGCDLRLYADWRGNLAEAGRELSDSDAALVTSYCPDAVPATTLVLDSSVQLRVFYDLDTPVTLARLEQGQQVEYLPTNGLPDFDLVLSYTGGDALLQLQRSLGARRVAPLYGSVDPDVHRPAASLPEFMSDLSYLGTYAADRQQALHRLFVEPALQAPQLRFTIGGAQYPPDFPWSPNIFFVRHLPPAQHPAFYCSSRATLNVTRAAMAELGYCPSGRLFEAAACGVPILTDEWDGLHEFYEPGSEILVCRRAEDILNALSLSPGELARIARAAKERTLAEHTSFHRARDLEAAFQAALRRLLRFTLTTASPRRSQTDMWGIIPAAGKGSRIQPLAFSKELLPVGSRMEDGVERPLAVSEYLVERMIAGGASKICFVVSPGKTDILEYYGSKVYSADVCYTVQTEPRGLCDALFCALPFIGDNEEVLFGLPDTVWFPKDAYSYLDDGVLSFLLFPVERPQFFDAVVTDDTGSVLEIQVKQPSPQSRWVWGAFKMPVAIFRLLHHLWCERGRTDEYIGTLVNAWLAGGGRAYGVHVGERYVDVGTVHGYREAITLLGASSYEPA